MHHIGIPDMLFAAKLMEITPPEMCLIGIQPQSMETSTELTDVVSNKMDDLLEIVLNKLKEWSINVLPKTTRPIPGHS